MPCKLFFFFFFKFQLVTSASNNYFLSLDLDTVRVLNSEKKQEQKVELVQNQQTLNKSCINSEKKQEQKVELVQNQQTLNKSCINDVSQCLYCRYDRQLSDCFILEVIARGSVSYCCILTCESQFSVCQQLLVSQACSMLYIRDCNLAFANQS